MADLISLVCPSCGGKLKIAQNATSMTCQHCGNEHMVKHDANGAIQLETYARCPVCGRNDRCEKVSAVIASQSHQISGTETKTETIVNPQGQRVTVTKEVPFTRQQVSVLGQQLNAPQEPITSDIMPKPPSQAGSIWAAIALGGVGLFLGAAGLVCVFAGIMDMLSGNLNSNLEELLIVILSSLGLLFLAVVTIGGSAWVGIAGHKAKTRKQNEFEIKVKRIQLERQRIYEAWQRAFSRWKNLYYCARDDVVFIPGEGDSAPLQMLEDYLYSVESLKTVKQ